MTYLVAYLCRSRCKRVWFQVVGVVTCRIGLWIVHDTYYLSPLFGTELMTVSAILIVVGGVSLVLLSLFGCLAAFYKNKCMLLMVRLTSPIFVLLSLSRLQFAKMVNTLKCCTFIAYVNCGTVYVCLTGNIEHIQVVHTTDFIYVVNSVITIQ